MDANVLFSALIKNSVTAELIFEDSIELYACDFIIEEFFKYEELILKKTKRTKEEFVQIMHLLKDIITVIPQEEYVEFMEEAENISPDDKDAAYLALAIKLKSGLWSNDKKLKQQDKVTIYSTSDLMKLF